MKNYFTNDELKCRCCGKLIIDKDFLEKLNQARELAGFPFTVRSGYRCPRHNKDCGSTSNNHTTGKAADIICLADFSRYEMSKAMISVGLPGIGVGPNWVHCDNNRTLRKMWTY